MEVEIESQLAVAKRVSRVIVELESWPDPLLSGEADAETLTDFRDALNRVRNTARAAQQSAAAPLLEEDSAKVASWFASERIRVACQLGLSIRDDMGRNDIVLQKGNCWNSTKWRKPWSMS